MNRIVAVTAAALIAACSPQGPAASADDALAFFHLGGEAAGRVSFASSEQRGATHVFNDVVFTDADGVETRVERVRLVNPRTTDAGAVFDSLEFENISEVTNEAAITLDRVLIEDPNAAFASLIAGAFDDDDAGRDVDLELGDITDYAFGAVVMEGFAVTGEEGSATLDSLRWEGFANGRLESGALEGLSGAFTGDDGTTGNLSLDSWTLEGVDLSNLPPMDMLDTDDPAALQAALVKSGFNDPFHKRFDAYAVRDARIEFDGVIVALDSVEASMRDTRGGLQTDTAINALTVDFDASQSSGAEALDALASLGYDRIEINGAFSDLADPQTDRIRAVNNTLRVTDAFTLDVSYDVAGVSAYLKSAAKMSEVSYFDTDPDLVSQMFAPLIINAVDVRLTDESLVERAFQAVAAEQNSTPEAVRAQATAFLAVGAMFAPPGPAQAIMGDAISAASEFLADPGVLRIAIEPDEPVSVAAVMEAAESDDPTAALTLLNLSIEAEPKAE